MSSWNVLVNGTPAGRPISLPAPQIMAQQNLLMKVNNVRPEIFKNPILTSTTKFTLNSCLLFVLKKVC